MRPIAQFKMGSSYFFSKYDDYNSKDVDEICIMDTFIPNAKTNVLNMNANGKDVFFYRNMRKEEFIEEVEVTGVYMKVGKFLIPEFSRFIGFGIGDLRKIRHLFDLVDDKHSYEQIIADAYLENNDFFLTEEQRQRAYDEYKRKRPERFQ